jgi:hypothetical protein
MRIFSLLVAAGSLAAAAAVAPGGPGDAWDDALAEAALKCQQVVTDQGAAVILDGLVVWTGPNIRGMTREMLDQKVGSWDHVVDLEIICRPELERLGIPAHEGLYMLTRASGVQSLTESLREIHALQVAHREEHGRWAASLQALGFDAPDAHLSLELAVNAEEESWVARGTHALGMRRCAVSDRGGYEAGGEDSVEDPAAPTCRRMAPTDEAFPRVLAPNGGP